MAQSAEPHHLGKLFRAVLFSGGGRFGIPSCSVPLTPVALKVWNCRSNWASPAWEFEWNGRRGIPLWEAVAQSAELWPTTWADSPGQFFLWRGKVWNSILFRSIDSCGFKNVELSLNLGSPESGISME